MNIDKENSGPTWTLSILQRILEAVKSLPFKNIATDSTGGYFCHMDSSGIISLVRMGQVVFDANAKLISLAQDMCYCGVDGTKDCKEISRRLWYGFSGLLNPLVDEAVILVLLILLGERQEDDVLTIVSAERNTYLRPLLEACRWTE